MNIFKVFLDLHKSINKIMSNDVFIFKDTVAYIYERSNIGNCEISEILILCWVSSSWKRKYATC